ncbi:MAG: glycosyltransferase family 2 protein [Deltaproteobacteria bacterium]|jgi:glycosyltransferase involved in cell wall biosynthesis|nr:glycosyltransferase family 2 protein [Deltaproteobacteria bacterium]
MPNPLLDALILTRNEAANIEECLASARLLGDILGEIIVIDDHSDDNTPEIAKKLGARVMTRKLTDFASQRNFALSQSQAPWVFFLDADERVSPELAAAIKEILAQGQMVKGAVKRRVFAFGRRQRFGPLAGDWVTRLFPKDQVEWAGLVHERPVAQLPEVRLDGHLAHHTYADWAEYLDKWRRYAQLWAKDAKLKGRTSSVQKAVSRAVAAFCKMFFGKLGFLGGPTAWALCWYYSGYTLSKYLLLADKAITAPQTNPKANPKDND